MEELKIKQKRISMIEQKREDLIIVHLNPSEDEAELMMITPSTCGKKLDIEYR